VFYRIAVPFVYVVERSAAFVSKLLGLKSQAQVRGHSAEELKHILRASQLREFERAAVGRLLELGDYSVREIMVPRNSIVSLPADADLDAVLRAVNEHQFSRFPVYDKDPEKLIGILHTKDLLAVWGERRVSEARRRPAAPFDLRRLLRKPPVVPESKPLDQMMEQLRTSHTHMALIVDEFGTIVGLVTLEDLIEQAFGEIEDEYDPHRPAPALESDELELDGGTNIRDLETQYGIELPSGAGFETLAGFLLFQLVSIPAGGEFVEYEGRRYTVVAMERNRIARVKVQRLHTAAAGPEPR
jgi:CBS domain containing-hemolysin-like protein